MKNKITGAAPENIRNEIKDVLEKFQEGYTKRDVKLVDEYMSELFAPANDIVILGTSNGEFCLGYDEAKELFEGDWEYWGDVKINIDDTVISYSDDTAWITTEGTLSQCFKDSEERYNGYLDCVKDDINNESMSLKERVASVSFVLSRFFYNAKKEKRNYLWPIRLSGVLTKNNGGWKFRQMQFSLPVKELFSDERILNEENHNKQIEEHNNKMKEFKKESLFEEEKEIKNILKEFQKDYLHGKEDKLSNYFSNDEDIYILNTDDTFYFGINKIKEIVQRHRGEWDKVEINLDGADVTSENNTAWITTTGTIDKKLEDDVLFQNVIDDIKNTMNNDMTSRDKLADINANISLAFKENASGEEYKLPFRIEAIMLKENGKWLIHNVKFSFPFNWILEGRRGGNLLED